MVSIRLWSFQAAPEHELWGKIERLTLLGVIVFAFIKRKSIAPRDYTFNKYISLLFIFSFAAFLPLYLFDNQSFIRSLNTNPHPLYWLVYWSVLSANLPKNDLLKFSIFVGCCWASFTIVQQFTYPHVFFFSRANFENEVPFEVRSGIFRFLVQGNNFGILTSLFALNRYLSTRKTKYIALVGLIVTGVYCTATRQLLVVNLLSLSFVYVSYLWRKGRRTELRVFALILFPAIGLLLFGEAIFGKLMAQTAEETTKDNVRIHAMRFFLFDYWPHWSNFLLGNGVPHYFSEKGLFLRKMEEEYGYFASDVGIVGILHYRGLIYTIVAILATIKGAFTKVRTDDLYLPAMFVCILSIISLNPVFISFDFYPFFCILCVLLEESKRPMEMVRPEPAMAIAPSSFKRK